MTASSYKGIAVELLQLLEKEEEIENSWSDGSSYNSEWSKRKGIEATLNMLGIKYDYSYDNYLSIASVMVGSVIVYSPSFQIS